MCGGREPGGATEVVSRESSTLSHCEPPESRREIVVEAIVNEDRVGAK